MQEQKAQPKKDMQELKTTKKCRIGEGGLKFNPASRTEIEARNPAMKQQIGPWSVGISEEENLDFFFFLGLGEKWWSKG